MKEGYFEANKRNYKPDNLPPLTPGDEALLQTTQFHQYEDYVVSESHRRVSSETTMKSIAAATKLRLFPGTSNYIGTVYYPELDYSEQTMEIHVKPYLKDIYHIGEKYYDWTKLIGEVVLRNFGRQHLEVGKEVISALIENYHYCILDSDGIKVMLQGNYNRRSEKYSPKNDFKSPIAATRW